MPWNCSLECNFYGCFQDNLKVSLCVTTPPLPYDLLIKVFVAGRCVWFQLWCFLSSFRTIIARSAFLCPPQQFLSSSRVKKSAGYKHALLSVLTHFSFPLQTSTDPALFLFPHKPRTVSVNLAVSWQLLPSLLIFSYEHNINAVLWHLQSRPCLQCWLREQPSPSPPAIHPPSTAVLHRLLLSFRKWGGNSLCQKFLIICCTAPSSGTLDPSSSLRIQWTKA